MICYIRHGETDSNKSHIICGGGKDVSLNENGVKQAKNAAKDLKKYDFDMVFCSPMKRDIETLNILLKGYKKVPVIFDDRLVERHYGKYEGASDEPFRVNGEFSYSYWFLDRDGEFETVETIKEMYERVKAFYDEVKKKYKGKNVLVVAHGGVGKLSKCYFLGFPKNGDLNEYFVPNSQIVVFDAKN